MQNIFLNKFGFFRLYLSKNIKGKEKMIKGCQKKIIFIKDTGSDFFEEAYFILKTDTPLSDEDETDMVKVATKIVNNSFAPSVKTNKKIKIRPCVRNFILGGLLGAAVCAAIFLIII